MLPNFTPTRTVQPIAEVSLASATDLSNPATVELIKQGGSVLSIALLCLFIWLLTRLIKVAKED